MKKIFASLALVALATAAFAQDAKLNLSGYLDTGLTAQFNGDNRAQTQLWADDAWTNGGRVRLYGSGVFGDNGVKFELRLNDWSNVNTVDASKTPNTVAFPLVVQNAYAYANFFNKMVYTQVGKIQEYSTRSGGDLGVTYTKDVVGAALVLKPIDGLALGAFAAPGNTAATNTTTLATLVKVGNAGYVPASAINAAGNFWGTITGASASYTLPGIFKVVGGSRMFLTAAGTYNLTDAYGAVGLLAVPDLTTWAEATAWNMNDGANLGVFVYTLNGSYDLNNISGAPVKLGLIGELFTYGKDYKTNGTDNLGTSMRLNGWASYALDGGVVPRFDLTYVSGVEATGTGFYSHSAYKGWNTINNTLTGSGVAGGANANLNSVATIHAKPSLGINLANGQFVNLVYIFSSSVGSTDLFFLTSTSAKTLHTVQANYTFRF